MKTRKYKPSDAAQIAELFQRSVLELGPRFYSDAQVAAWAARGPSPDRVRARNADGLITFVKVDDNDRVMAYAELETDGHIDQVYAHPDVAGQGFVSALMEELEIHARAMGLRTLYSEASEGARPLFLKKGFVDQGRRDFEIGSVSIHNYAMRKAL